jgi:DNA-binding response OmpR family regulator
VDPDTVDCGDLRMDRSAHQAWVAGRSVHLSHLQFVLLWELAHSAGRVVAEDVLLAVHGGTSSLRNVQCTISRIRSRLGTGPRRPRIVRERGRGYVLVGP